VKGVAVVLAVGLVVVFAACAKVDQAGMGAASGSGGVGLGLGLPGSGGSTGAVPLSGSGGRTLISGNGQGGEMSCGL